MLCTCLTSVVRRTLDKVCDVAMHTKHKRNYTRTRAYAYVYACVLSGLMSSSMHMFRPPICVCIRSLVLLLLMISQMCMHTFSLDRCLPHRICVMHTFSSFVVVDVCTSVCIHKRRCNNMQCVLAWVMRGSKVYMHNREQKRHTPLCNSNALSD